MLHYIVVSLRFTLRTPRQRVVHERRAGKLSGEGTPTSWAVLERSGIRVRVAGERHARPQSGLEWTRTGLHHVARPEDRGLVLRGRAGTESARAVQSDRARDACRARRVRPGKTYASADGSRALHFRGEG